MAILWLQSRTQAYLFKKLIDLYGQGKETRPTSLNAASVKSRGFEERRPAMCCWNDASKVTIFYLLFGDADFWLSSIVCVS